MQNSPTDSKEAIFESVAASIVSQLYRMRASDAALFRMLATFAGYALARHKFEKCDCLASQILSRNFDKIDPPNVDILDEEYSKKTVITAISLVDSFLTDVLRLLLLKYPHSIPKERQVKVSEILSVSDHDELVSQLIEKYVREVGYQSITDRLAFLEQKFGIKNLRKSPLKDRLVKHAELRNSLIHDLSLFSYRVHGPKIVASSRADRMKVEWADAEKVVDDSIAIIEAVFSAVTLHIYGKAMSIHGKDDDTAKK